MEKLRPLKEVNLIVWHCSDLAWGTAEGIRRYHTQYNGWADCGYHWVMHNGYRAHGAEYDKNDDGRLYVGRKHLENGDLAIGAHAKGYNLSSIGLCWVGREPSALQVAAALGVTRYLMDFYELPARKVVGHYELTSSKTCPNFDMRWFREAL